MKFVCDFEIRHSEFSMDFSVSILFILPMLSK